MHCGDNLPILREMADNSVDAIVTDPPYGLNDGTETLQDVFFAKFFNVFFPQFNKLVPRLLNQSQFALPPERISLLDLMNRAIDIHSRVGVPEGSVDFNNCIVGWNEKIKDAYESPLTVSHGMLSNEIDLQLTEEAFDFTLQLRRCFNATLGDSATIGITECGFGRLGVLIVIHPQSRFASFLRSHLPSQSSSLTDVVGLLTDPARLSKSASKVVTSRGTELRAMLTLDSTSGTYELIPAGATCQVDAVFELVPTQNVRTLTGTSGLASVFQALRVGEVKDVTARAFTLNIHQFIVPYLNKKAKGFMGKRWDYDVPSVELWAECLRVLKPGGHLLAFAGTRTQHRMAVRIEDAGFEIRDMIAWVYGSGFPKSLDVSKAIDKAAGAKREVQGVAGRSGSLRNAMAGNFTGGDYFCTTPATDAAKQWDGWGTALKPALEPITLARKPLDERTIAANVLTWGTGGVNVDGCRVGTESTITIRSGNSGAHGRYGKDDRVFLRENPPGRFPANLIHDGSDDVVRLFPVTTSGSGDKRAKKPSTFNSSVNGRTLGLPTGIGGDTGSAARFFYCAKASRSEREAGLEGVEPQLAGCMNMRNDNHAQQNGLTYAPKSNHHPTVKPIALMRYLCRLVTPPGGIVLDPFTGSGTTGCAATLEGFGFIGIERESEYAEIARRRIEHWKASLGNIEVEDDSQGQLFEEVE